MTSWYDLEIKLLDLMVSKADREQTVSCLVVCSWVANVLDISVVEIMKTSFF